MTITRFTWLTVFLALSVAGFSCGSKTTSGTDEPDNHIVNPWTEDAGRMPEVPDEDAGRMPEVPDEDVVQHPADVGLDSNAPLAEVESLEETKGDKETKEQPANCVDKDNDGYGDNCYLGKDCDDANPKFTIYCPPCAQQTAEGCKCSPEGAQEVCYESDPGSVGVGECQLGMRQCSGGFWTGCLEQVVPVPEVCDGLDNDCDGAVDEGVLSPCGDCDPFCDTLELGPDSPFPFEADAENAEGVGVNIDGYLILDSSQLNLGFIWVANSGEGTVSKLDTDTGEELGRYKTCNDPSRTAVDLIGNVWVGCRADGGVAKIAIDEALCVDKNGNGEIDTSHGSNVLPAGTDECILMIAYPGGSCARALGVDKDNYAWVGMWNSKVLRRLHPDTGQVVQSISIPCNPYGLVIDGNGIIWVSGRGGDKLVRADPATGNVQNWGVPGGNLYGINLDCHGNPWLGQFTNGKVARFTPGPNTFSHVTTGGCPRGMAGSTDCFMWTGLGCGGDTQVAKIDVDTLQVWHVSTHGPKGSGTQPIGVALDAKGFLWAVNYGTSNATKIDTQTHEQHGPYPVGYHPYTYSDMTGYALHNFTAPQGNYTAEFGGWEEFRVKWEALYVEADMPENSYLKLEVRTANTQEELAATPWEGVYGPYPPETFPLLLTQVPNMDGKILQVKLWLYSADKLSTPIVKAIKAKFSSE